MLSTLLLRGHMGPATTFDIIGGSIAIGLFFYNWFLGWVNLFKRKRQERRQRKATRPSLEIQP